MTIAGIDEAGRGAVVGPLVVAGVSVAPKNQEKLEALGLRDSKDLSPKQREVLATQIEALAKDIVVMKLSACKIDNMRKDGINLNRIESDKFGDILALLDPTTTYIDSPDVKPERLAGLLQKHTSGALVVEHKADARYPIVSAASIIAKVERDREVKELHKTHGNFGPGYSSNDQTMAWLRQQIQKHGKYPDIVRRSWETSKRIKAEFQQQGIGGFFRHRGKKDDGCQDPRD